MTPVSRAQLASPVISSTSSSAVRLPRLKSSPARRVSWHRPEDHAHMLEDLRKAGMLEE